MYFWKKVQPIGMKAVVCKYIDRKLFDAVLFVTIKTANRVNAIAKAG